MSNKLIYNLYQLFSRQPCKRVEISPRDAFEKVSQGTAVLVDVREQDEIEEGMAAPAQWMPTSEIDENSPRWKGFIETLPKNKPVILYCAAGVRSGRAAALLETLGYQTLNVGGYNDWTGAGLPTRKP